jgi:thymidylate synthase
MAAERELGPIYGFQWRHFGSRYRSWDSGPEGEGIDQLRTVVEKLKENPDDRRMIVSAWNPVDFHRMALPPCHYAFQVTVTEGKVNLLWNQRSVDVALGLPFNIASYALLLHLLAREAGLGEGRLVGFLADTHIYVNHVEGLREQLSREPHPLPAIHTEPFTSIFDWRHEDSRVEAYRHHPRIKFEVAV